MLKSYTTAYESCSLLYVINKPVRLGMLKVKKSKRLKKETPHEQHRY